MSLAYTFFLHISLFSPLLFGSSHRSGRVDITLGSIYEIEELEGLRLELHIFFESYCNCTFWDPLKTNRNPSKIHLHLALVMINS